MAEYWPLQSGNWSTLSIWASSDGVVSGMAGSLPTSNDNVYANNRFVSINTDFHVNLLSNHRQVIPNVGVILSGGGFDFYSSPTTTNRTITATVLGGGISYPNGTVNVLAYYPDTLTIIGNLTGIVYDPNNLKNLQGGIAVWKKNTCTLNVKSKTIGGNFEPFTSLNNQAGVIYAYDTGSGVINLTGDIIGGNNLSYPGVYIANGNVKLSIVGNVSGSRTNLSSGIIATTSEPLSIYIKGNVHGGVSSSAVGININNVTFAPYIYIDGNVYGGSASTAVNSTDIDSTIIVTGDAVGGTGNDTYAIAQTDTGVVVVSGKAIGGTGSSAHGIYNSGAGSVSVSEAISNNWGRGEVVIGGPSYGVVNNNIYGTVTVKKLKSGARGLFPVAGSISLTKSSDNQVSLMCVLSTNESYLPKFFPINQTYVKSVSNDTNYSSAVSGITGFNLLFTSLSRNTIVPPVSDVRLGTIYDVNTKIGTVIIPLASAVDKGVPVDNTTGTALNDITLVWTTPWSIWDYKPATLGYRVINSISIERAGDLITGFL